VKAGRFGRVLATLSLLGAGQTNAENRTALLGNELKVAQQTFFFGWFHLEQVGTRPTAGGRIVTYRPSGERFHDLAALEVEVDGKGAICKMDLVLRRAFVSSPTDGPFAADIVSSFVGNALTESDVRELATFIDEMRYRGQFSNVLVGPTDQAPSLPKTPTPAYDAYSGKRASFAETLGSATLVIKNEHLPSGDLVRVSVSRAIGH